MMSCEQAALSLQDDFKQLLQRMREEEEVVRPTATEVASTIQHIRRNTPRRHNQAGLSQLTPSRIDDKASEDKVRFQCSSIVHASAFSRRHRCNTWFKAQRDGSTWAPSTSMEVCQLQLKLKQNARFGPAGSRAERSSSTVFASVSERPALSCCCRVSNYVFYPPPVLRTPSTLRSRVATILAKSKSRGYDDFQVSQPIWQW